MRLLSVVGARPQFVKLAPIAEAAAACDVEHVIVHTGQHYDADMSDNFFADLAIPSPDLNLAVGSGPHGAQTGAMLSALEPVLADIDPDWVLVYGDTNSTLAAAICAVKLHLPLAHLEAGLRSYNRRMPEEHNRVLTDHAADLCLAPTQNAVEILAQEGLDQRTAFVGDVMVDVFQRVASSLPQAAARPRSRPYVLATIHRAENTDDGPRLAAIIAALGSLPYDVILPIHPRLQARTKQFGIDLDQGALRPVAPLGYPELVGTLVGSTAVVTDSGGLQKEAFVAGIPTATVRDETEWIETLVGEWNVLVKDPAEIRKVTERPRPTSERGEPFGDGRAASLVVQTLVSAARHSRGSAL